MRLPGWRRSCAIDRPTSVLPIRALARESSIPQRRLERLFRTQTGLSAKALSRIVCFNRAQQLIERDPGIDLTELTMEAGYSDQAHFSKTFKEMFGITPGTFKAQMATANALIVETNRLSIFYKTPSATGGTLSR